MRSIYLAPQGNPERGSSQHLSKFLNADPEVGDDCAQGFPLQIAGVNRYHHPRTVEGPDVNSMASALAAKLEPEALRDTRRLF